jgi:hypothetical protein
MSIFGEPHWRLRVVARRLKLPIKQARIMFLGRPGVVVLRSPRTAKRYILIPERLLNERVWTVAGLAHQYRLPVEAVVDLFEGEDGTYRQGPELMIPESVRARVFHRNSSP